MTTAKSFFNNDYILDTILGKLPLRNKLTAQLVCQRWKDRSNVFFKKHKSVVLSTNRPGQVYVRKNNCKEHAIHQENVMTFELHDMKSWRRLLSFLPGIQFLYLDINPNVAIDIWYTSYRELLKYIVEMYASQLQCFWIPFHREETYYGEFLATDCFPQLRHLHCSQTSDTNLVRIIKSCPRLEYLNCWAHIIEWNLLPNGFKKIECSNGYVGGMVNLLTCKAAETIEEILGIHLVSDILENNFSLPRLNTLDVFIYEDINDCLNNLARILRFSPVLKKLSIRIGSTAEDINASSWIKVIEECCKMTDLTICLTTNRPLMKVSLWQDAFAESVSLNMKQLKTLKLDFALSSIGLIALSSLPELQLFHHKLYINKQSDLDDSFFNEKALYQFLQIHFSRKLHHYDINIPRFFLGGAYLPVSQEFVDRLVQDLTQDLGVSLIMESDYREVGVDNKKKQDAWNGVLDRT